MPPWAVDYEFTQHVGIALLCVFVALFVVFLVAMIPIEDDPVRRRQNRKE